MISLFTFSYFWAMFITHYACWFKLDQLLYYTWFLHAKEDWLPVLEFIASVGNFQLTLYNNIIVMLNLCLCLDLVLTLKDPFTKAESRYPIYFVGSILASLLPASARVALDHINMYLYGWLVVSIFATYVVIAAYSSFFAYKALKRPGVSSVARQMINRRHITYIIVNVLCQLYNNYSRVILSLQPNKTHENWFLDVLVVLYFGQGVWLNLVRLWEPSLPPALWYYTKQIFGCCSKSKAGAAEVPDSENPGEVGSTSQNRWKDIEDLTANKAILATLKDYNDVDAISEEEDDEQKQSLHNSALIKMKV